MLWKIKIQGQDSRACYN